MPTTTFLTQTKEERHETPADTSRDNKPLFQSYVQQRKGRDDDSEPR